MACWHGSQGVKLQSQGVEVRAADITAAGCLRGVRGQGSWEVLAVPSHAGLASSYCLDEAPNLWSGTPSF